MEGRHRWNEREGVREINGDIDDDDDDDDVDDSG